MKVIEKDEKVVVIILIWHMVIATIGLVMIYLVMSSLIGAGLATIALIDI